MGKLWSNKPVSSCTTVGTKWGTWRQHGMEDSAQPVTTLYPKYVLE